MVIDSVRPFDGDILVDMREIWRLQHFLGVVEAASINGCRARLNISQPALTKSIRQLEAAFGRELFLRLPRGVRLTEAGELLHLRAREIEAAWNAAIVEVGAQSTGAGRRDADRRRAGLFSQSTFPKMLADLRRRFPNLRVQVTTGVGNELLPLLKTGDIRAYAGGVPTEEGGLGPDFETEELYRQDNAIYASQDHPLFRAGAIEPGDTLAYPWLCLFSGQQANIRIESYFSRLGLAEPRLALESHSLQIAFKMIADHQFIACMPVPLALRSPELQLREIELDNFRWSIRTGVTYHRSSINFAPIRQMLRSLRKETAKQR